MANLNVESLNSTVQTGNIERLFGGSRETSQPGQIGEGSESAHLSADGTSSFSQILKDSVDKVNQYQAQADTSVKELVAGRNKNIHETMLTVERADTSLKLMMQVRNKILDAYREIMRMQV